MGEIRDNFKKAMSEMFGVGADAPDAAPSRELNPTEQAVQAAVNASGGNVPQKPVAVPLSVEPKPEPAVAPENVQTEPAKPQPTPFMPPQVVETRTEETYISKDTVICGDIQSGSNLRIRGKVAGNIACDNDVMLSGKLEGNLAGKNAFVDGGQIVGNVDVRGNLRVQNDSRIKGDLQCSNLELDSAVSGNLHTAHKSVFHANATVIGNIATQTIVVEEGAMLEGYVSMKNMQAGRVHFNKEEN